MTPPSNDEPDPSTAEPTVVLNHVGHCVRDLARARRFYEELLGFVFARELVVPDEAVGPLLRVAPPVGLTAVYLTCGAFTLELMVFDRPDNPPRAERVFNEPGLTHLSISVHDLDAVVSRVPEFGGEVLSHTPYVAMVRDPDGQFVELLPMSYHRSVA